MRSTLKKDIAKLHKKLAKTEDLEAYMNALAEDHINEWEAGTSLAEFLQKDSGKVSKFEFLWDGSKGVFYTRTVVNGL